MPVSLVIENGRLIWFGPVKHNLDEDWVKHCTTLEVDGTKQRKIWLDCVKNDTDSS